MWTPGRETLAKNTIKTLRRKKPLPSRWNGDEGQQVVDFYGEFEEKRAKGEPAGVVGVDVERTESGTFLEEAATRRYSLAELRAAFDAGVRHAMLCNGMHTQAVCGDDNGAFKDYLETLFGQRANRKRKK